MPTINENQFFTVIIEFDVAPENQQALIDGIADEVERLYKSYVGFISASFHASEDGRRVIKYAQWRSKEDWSRAIVATSEDETDETESIILNMISRYATSEGKLDTFRVARVVNNEEQAKRILVLGKLPQVLQSVTEPLDALGFTVQGSTDWECASEKFDAKDFDLIAFGSALIGSVSERLRLEFGGQNPSVKFVDAFGPIAVKQIVAAFDGNNTKYISDFSVAEDDSDYLVRATILEPCSVRIEVYQIPGVSPPDIKLVVQTEAVPGNFETRVDAKYRKHGLELVMTVNDCEYYLHRILEDN